MTAVAREYFQEVGRQIRLDPDYPSDHSDWWHQYDQELQQQEADMKWKDTGGGVDFEPAPADTHISRCYQIIDLGTHYNERFDNRRHQVFIGFELPGEMRKWKDKEGEEKESPCSIGGFYTMSLSEKANLRHVLESWRGRAFTAAELEGFDPKNILGAPAILSIVHETGKNGKVKAKIAAISKMMKGAECPKAVNETVYFSLDEFTEASFEKVPGGFREIIKKSEEWAKLVKKGVAENGGFVDDDIPEDLGGSEDIPF